ncbi:hypothetical protein ACQP3C_31435, partial [Escherichia coli]
MKNISLTEDQYDNSSKFKDASLGMFHGSVVECLCKILGSSPSIVGRRQRKERWEGRVQERGRERT